MNKGPQTETGGGSGFLASLAFRDYRTLWTANLSAGAAAWALIVARGLLVYQLADTNQSLWVGVVTFGAMIPRVVVSPFTGYLSDRFDRRAVLASMFALNLGHTLFLGVLVLTGNAEIWHVVVLAVVNGSFRAAQMPAGQALLPNLIPRRLLLNGIALSQATMQGSRLLGPAAIAPLLVLVGPSGAFFLCAGFYAISLIQTLRIRTASTGNIDKNQSFLENLAAGAVYVYKTPNLRAIVFLALFHCGLTMSFESLLPVLSSEKLNMGNAGFAYFMMAVGAGALVSSLTLAGIQSEVTRGRLFLYLGLFSGATPIVLGMSSSIPMALVGAVLMGVSQAAFMTLTHTMIQSIVSDNVRGRVGGIYSVHIGGMMATANLFNAALADRLNAPVLLIGGGLTFIAVMLISWQYRSLRNIYRRGLPQEAPAAAD